MFLYQASADDKISTPSDAGSDQKVKMEGLAQRTIGSENNSNQLPTHITEPTPITGREYFSAAADKLAKEISAYNASYRSMPSPVASENDTDTGGRVGMDRAKESEVLTRLDPGGSIRHSAQNSDITREERQASISRQQVTNITKMFDKNMKFTGEIGNGNVTLGQAISAYRSICQAIVSSDEVTWHAMFTIFSDAVLAYFYELDTEWYSVAKFLLDCADFFLTLLLSRNSRSSEQSTRSYGLSPTIQILRTTMHCSDACSHADASSRSNCPLKAMTVTCSYEIFCIDAPATLLSLRTCRLSKVKRLVCT
jgi:hypothetical protein